MAPGPLNVLVVYATLSNPLRSSLDDHLHAFERAGGHRCFYLNLMVRRVPRWLLEVEFDLIVFHTSFLSQRWVPRHFAKVRRRAARLRKVQGIRVALPQDEFLRSDLLAEFIEEAGVSVVCSVAPLDALPVIYPTVDRDAVKFVQILTGYLDDHTVARIDRILGGSPDRRIDIGYRAWAAAPWLGRHGQLKTRIAEAVSRAAEARGLITDVSTAKRDQLVGDDWFKFLASCHATIGVEGGASVCDRDGSVKAATEAYLDAHPGASFAEIEANCFPGRDGELPLAVLSPRHLEACATRTCQILIEGEYNGVLEAGVHYVPLRPDLSDLDEALSAASDPVRRAAIVEAAHRDVVRSRRWTYSRLVDEVVEAALGHQAESRGVARTATALHRRAQAFDRRSWRHVSVKGRALQLTVRMLGPVVRRLRTLGRVVRSSPWRRAPLRRAQRQE